MPKLSSYLSLITKSAATFHLGGKDATLTLLNKANINNKSLVLDIGCGAGHSSAMIAKHFGCQVIGVDLSQDAIKNAQSIYGNSPLKNRISFQEGDILSLPFKDNHFDFILCESVLLFVHDKEKALLELKRVLKPSCFIGINEIGLQGNKQKLAKDFFAHEYFGITLENINFYEKLYKKTGFSTILQVQNSMNAKKWIEMALQQFLSPQGIFACLELGHMALVNTSDKENFMDILKICLPNSKYFLQNLSLFLFLLQK